MPIYEYSCSKCCERFSVMQKMDTGPNDTHCPKCGSTQVKKLISSFCCSSGSGSGISSSMPSSGFGGG